MGQLARRSVFQLKIEGRLATARPSLCNQLRTPRERTNDHAKRTQVSPSFVDGDTISDRVIYRQSERRFYYVYSTTGAGYFTQWGSTTSDEPAADFMR